VNSFTAKDYFGDVDAITGGNLTPNEYVLCPLCGIDPVPFAIDYQGFTLCRCSRCSLEFVSPRLSFDELAEKIYSANYFPKLGVAPPISTETQHYFPCQMTAFERLLNDRRKVLDIGCGNGAFLKYAHKRGWQIPVVEFKLSTDARSLSCPLWEGRLENIDFGNACFDLIRINHVLEHMQYPVCDLKILRDLLAPGGILYISVPNIRGISPSLKSLQSRLKLKSRRWRHYAAMHHLFFFSPNTLTAIIERAGFKVLEWNTPIPRKTKQSAIVEKFYRLIMERTNSSSIMDFYCTPV